MTYLTNWLRVNKPPDDLQDLLKYVGEARDRFFLLSASWRHVVERVIPDHRLKQQVIDHYEQKK